MNYYFLLQLGILPSFLPPSTLTFFLFRLVHGLHLVDSASPEEVGVEVRHHPPRKTGIVSKHETPEVIGDIDDRPDGVVGCMTL